MKKQENNGWIKTSDYLPLVEETVIWLRDEGEAPIIGCCLDSDFYGLAYFTHWRPLEFEAPLY